MCIYNCLPLLSDLALPLASLPVSGKHSPAESWLLQNLALILSPCQNLTKLTSLFPMLNTRFLSCNKSSNCLDLQLKQTRKNHVIVTNPLPGAFNQTYQQLRGNITRHPDIFQPIRNLCQVPKVCRFPHSLWALCQTLQLSIINLIFWAITSKMFEKSLVNLTTVWNIKQK